MKKHTYELFRTYNNEWWCMTGNHNNKRTKHIIKILKIKVNSFFCWGCRTGSGEGLHEVEFKLLRTSKNTRIYVIKNSFSYMWRKKKFLCYGQLWMQSFSAKNQKNKFNSKWNYFEDFGSTNWSIPNNSSSGWVWTIIVSPRVRESNGHSKVYTLL